MAARPPRCADRRLVLPPVRARGAASGPEPLRCGSGGVPDRPGRRCLRVPVRAARAVQGRQRPERAWLPGHMAPVAGAPGAIGAATVRRLVADGWSVVAVDACTDDPALSYPMATKADLDALTALGAVTTAVADVRSCDALASAVDLAESTYGGLDAAL